MTPLLGATVGPYRLEEIVTRDALGVVHRAHEGTSGRAMLVRLLLPLANDEGAARRFRIEMAAIGGLDHPNILRVERWGEAEGVPYVVTADPAAQRLSDFLAAGRRLDPRLAMKVLRGLASALDHAHLAGVVHGAVDPTRVVLGRDGTVRLADFGLTLLAGAAPDTDLQALAVIAWTLLGGSQMRTAVEGVVRRRWETAGAMVDALQVALVGRPPQAATTAPQWRELWTRVSSRFQSPRALAIAAGATVLLLLLAIVAFATHAARPAPSLALSAAQARAGDTILVRGANLPAGQPGTVVLQGRPAPLGQFRSDDHGAFTFRFVVPPDLAGGRRVEACWGGSCPIGQSLTVVAEPTPGPTATPLPVPVQTLAPPTPDHRFDPSISLSHQAVRHGDSVQVTGRGFDPAGQYVIVFQQTGSSQVLQGATSPDDKGSFRRTIRIPTDARRGLAVVAACISAPAGGQVSACAQQAVLVT